MLPVLFRWIGNVEHRDVGHCKNAGLRGMFIFSANCPPLGMDVDLDLEIPASGLVPRPMKLCFVGQVNRIEAYYNLSSGFALAGRIKGDHFEGDEFEGDEAENKEKEPQEEIIIQEQVAVDLLSVRRRVR
jgi:hypothetical protein